MDDLLNKIENIINKKDTNENIDWFEQANNKMNIIIKNNEKIDLILEYYNNIEKELIINKNNDIKINDLESKMCNIQVLINNQDILINSLENNINTLINDQNITINSLQNNIVS